MRTESHVVIGIAAGLALHLARPYVPDGLVGLSWTLAANVLGSLLPDVDADESRVRRFTGTNRRAGFLGRLVSLGARLSGGHRALTHTALAMGLLAGLAWWTGQPWAWAGAAGYAAHVIADSLTLTGVPLLWPVTARRIHLLPRGMRFRTGAPLEYLLVMATAVWGVRVWPPAGLALDLSRGW